MDDEDWEELDPVQVALQAVFNTPQMQGILNKTQELLDRAGRAIERGPMRQQPQPRPGKSTPRVRYARAKPAPDPLVLARMVLLFDKTEPLDKERISKRRRALAAACHPDQGGSTEAMMRINGAADALLASL